MNLGYNKLHLNRNKNVINLPQGKQQKVFNLKPLFLSLGILFGILLVLSLAIIIPGRAVLTALKKTRASASQVYNLGKNQDIEGIKNQSEILKKDLADLDITLKKLDFVGFLPFIGIYQKDSRHLVKGAVYAVEALQETVNTIIPYSDLLGLKGQSKFVSGSADDRIKTAVETIDKVVPNIDKIAGKLELAQKEIDSVDFNRYPKQVGKTMLRENLVSGKELFNQTAALFIDAKPLLKKLPDLLGNKKGQKYLFLFQNDAELRATGGFMTAFAIFDVNKGKLTVDRSDDIYKLDEAKKKQFPAPEKILTYHKDVRNYQLRDSNLSPDFITSMQSFENLLKESSVDLGQYEGIITLDTHVLVSTVKILGEFNVVGRSFSSEIDKRCDCPKVIYELEDYATRPVAFLREDRKGVIGALMYQIMQRALGVSPSQYWGKLFQMFIEEAQQKHILFYFKDAEAQKGIESLNFGGRIKDFKGDYLHVSNVNFAGAKSNLFVKNNVKQEISQNGGKLEKTVVLTYKNPAPPSNCNLEAGQLCLNGILRNWLRIFVPKGSELIEFNGSEMKTLTYEELGKTVFEGLLTIKPQGSAEVKIKYRLPENITAKSPYSLLIQKQPGTDKEEYTVIYQGKEEKFILETDKLLSF